MRSRAAEAKLTRPVWQPTNATPDFSRKPNKAQLDTFAKFTGLLWYYDEARNELFVRPPKFTELTDESVYWVTKHCSQAERGADYPVDFDANNDIKGNRAPMGPPPIIMVNGSHCLPVWKGYIVACGEYIAAVI